jgi:uncharacterized coiled-coil protein SlyX
MEPSLSFICRRLKNKSTEQEEKLKELKEDIARRQEQLNRLAERVREVESGK